MVKKLICISLAVLLVGCVLFLFFGCSSVNGLSWTQVWGIQSAYLESTGESNRFLRFAEVKIEKYLGTYNDNIVVIVRDKNILRLDNWNGKIILDDVYVGEEEEQTLFMLYVPSEKNAKDKIVHISVAYEKGLLTKSDLENIAEMEAKAQKSE